MIRKIYLLFLVLTLSLGAIVFQSFQLDIAPSEKRKAKKELKQLLKNLKKVVVQPLVKKQLDTTTTSVLNNIYTLDSLSYNPLNAESSYFYAGTKVISNQEYRAFTTWVRDSVGHFVCGHTIELPGGIFQIDWSQELDWLAGNFLGDMAKDKSIKEKWSTYDYVVYDYAAIAEVYSSEKEKIKPNRADYIKRTAVNVCPDTLAWQKELSKAYGITPKGAYFSNPIYNDNPVVGVSYLQAKAYCDWRSKELEKQWNLAGYKGFGFEFRLPTKMELKYILHSQESELLEKTPSFGNVFRVLMTTNTDAKQLKRWIKK